MGTDPGQVRDQGADGKPLKIAVIGTAPGWEQAPFDDPSWQIWGISRLYDQVPRWDVWFELHKRSEICRTWEGDKVHEDLHRKTYLEWLGAQLKPVIIGEPMPEVPNGRPYPLQAVLQAYPRPYFTNTISYLIALAILQENVAEIGVWGVDMALDSEYGSQRPSCEYFLGIAEGRGIKVTIPAESDLLKCRSLYAFQPTPSFDGKLRAKKVEFQQRLAQVTQQLEGLKVAHATLKGALDMTNYIERSWSGD